MEAVFGRQFMNTSGNHNQRSLYSTFPPFMELKGTKLAPSPAKRSVRACVSLGPGFGFAFARDLCSACACP